MFTRRQLLRFGAASGIAGATGGLAGLAGQFGAAPATARVAAPAATPVTPFTVPMTVPQTLRPVLRTATTDYYSVTMHRRRLEIVPGSRTEVYTYNGDLPGPTIRAFSGRRVVVRQRNRLHMPTAVHLHGGATAPEDDGSGQAVIPPGGERVYTYPNRQPHATLWMHDHTHHMEAEHLYRGLSSLYLLTDRTERALSLPRGRFDVPLVLRDAHLDADAQLVWNMDDADNRTTLLVNGRPWPRFEVQARRYRFRLVNSSNLRFFLLRLADGGDLTVIGSDGGLLEAPVTMPYLMISPGERLDVVVDFARYQPGTSVVLQNLMGPGPAEMVGQVMRFDVVPAKRPDRTSVPQRLRSLPPLPTPTVRRSIELRMDEPGSGGHQAYIDGKVFDPARIDTTIAWGSTEEWTVTNANVFMPHNFHMHLVQFRVLDRNGAPPDPTESGLKDTVIVWPGQSVRLQATFDTWRGVYPYHCHMVDHSAMGMMANLRIV
ncbi:Multicopper oxidase with three cupredoxin domains (includes cell division protein FtsP and spore coat protein CotA) [Micromonospora nigra]|uniref:Multicopper oxidase CueO n=1 Tax=Micromonospora nigra TaxID=145857 RepID=A0A1C6S840_9ACTN|nr:multicopper oxidase domain-containing protein [Micromonospora nigra]SCL25639.1 Multicopper oxidase with three cupredoxin domains (includes cell division protein FtsP and spore coat protein CotA) [Micromonospora nigra]